MPRVVEALSVQGVGHVVEFHAGGLALFAAELPQLEVKRLRLHQRILRQPDHAHADALRLAEGKDLVQRGEVVRIKLRPALEV